MRHESHKTWISILREAVNDWRKREQWSRETVAQRIVETHELRRLDDLTGIRFEPNTRDAFERTKVNADRIFRWLDDETKDSSLLPANFIDTVLGALPADLRMRCVDEMLRPLGIASRSLEDTEDSALDVRHHLCDMIREDSEAQRAIADLMDGANPHSLERAHREVTESIEANTRIRRVIEGAMSKVGKVMQFRKDSAG